MLNYHHNYYCHQYYFYIQIIIIVLYSLCYSSYAIKTTSLEELPTEQVLLDTIRDDNSKGWTGWITNTGEFDGWKVGNSGSITSMTYSVCQLTNSNADYWLRTPGVNVIDSKNAVTVEIHFSMRSCTNHPDPSVLKNCKETLDLMLYESSVSSSTDLKNADHLNETFYKKSATVAPSVKWESFDASKGIESITNIVTIPVKLTRGMAFFAIRDKGSCVALFRVRIFYNVCPRKMANFTVFERTAAPFLGDVVSIKGTCVAGAEPRIPNVLPSKICKSNGQWFTNDRNDDCHCKAGYYPQGTTICEPCPSNLFKAVSGNSSCLKCPSNSFTTTTGSTQCQCREGYYKINKDGINSSCTQPPSAPRDAIVRENSLSRVVITWSAPSNSGGRNDLAYFVDCHTCPTAGLTYQPGQSVDATMVTIQGLQPLTKYQFRIYALNGVSTMAHEERSRYTLVTVQTSSAVPNKLENIRVTVVNSNAVKVSWELPNNLIMEEYEIQWRPQSDPSQVTVKYTDKKEYYIGNMLKGVNYIVKVRGRSALGWGDFSSELTVNTETTNQQTGTKPEDLTVDGVNPTSDSSGGPQNSVHIIVGAVVAVLLCLIIVLTMIILMIRRGYWFGLKRKKMLSEKSGTTDCHMIPYSNIVPGFQLPASFKSYVDPHTYEDPCQAVQEFTKEIDISQITIECVLGGGEFGDVCLGTLRVAGRPEQRVAIKTLKIGASEKNRLDFLTEASIMGQFDDPNVIYLEGVVTRASTIMIVTEYMANGSLDSYLRSHDGEFSCHQLLCMLRGIASGMRYLSEMGYIHRDLAARNVLVNENLICKVSDFGLSREIEITDSKDGTYTTRGGKIPVRWTSPEAIHYRKFTSASDVWSFGIVMWEVMAFGERPYWNWTNNDVVAAVENGFRLPSPMDCPDCVHQLMLDCWKWERSERPKMAQIVQILDNLIRQPELLVSTRPRPVYDAPSLTLPSKRYANVPQWLMKLKLDMYVDNFYRYGVTNMEMVPQLTLSDLLAMGINVPSHQSKLLNAVQNVKVQQQQQLHPSLQLYDRLPMESGYIV